MRPRSCSIALLAAVLACQEPGGAPAPDASSLAPDAAVAPDAAAPDATPVPDGGSPDGGDPRPVDPMWQGRSGTPPSVILGRWGAPMAYVPGERRFILFGGSQYPQGGVAAETWSYAVDDDVWSEVITTGAPTPRYCHGLVYLPDQHQVLLVGGRDANGPVGGAWLLDLATSTWEELTGTLPPGVIGPSVVWMPNLPGGGRAVIFGGSSRRGLPSDTFYYDPVARTFERKATDHSPPGRQDAAMAYDPGSGKLLLFGGAYQIFPTPAQYADLWSFDGGDWVRTTSTAGAAWPPPRRSMGAAFDERHREWVMFSGTVETDDPADLWLYDAAAGEWRALPYAGAPPPRGFPAFGLADEVFLVFGGLSQPNFRALTDGWSLRLRQ